MAHDVLPTVKCSTCGQPVPLASLGDHECPPQKPLPHQLVAKSSSDKEPERVPPPSRDPFQRLTPDQSGIPPKSSPPERAAPTPPLPPPDRVSTPLRDPLPPALQRARIPSNASRITPISPARPAFPVPFGEPAAYPVPRRPTPLSSTRRDNPSPSPPTQQPLAPRTDRASSNATPPSTDRVPTLSTLSTSHPSLDKPPPSLDKFHPSLITRRPSHDSSPFEQNPFAHLSSPLARPLKTVVPTPGPGPIPFPSSTPILPPPTLARQPPPPLSLTYSHALAVDREIDTKIGGEAGMAGVGRRGFAAAARAAMFATSRSPSHQPARDGQRVNAPQYLESNVTFGPSHVTQVAITPPPLSPNSVQTPSPVSPFPVSPVSIGKSIHANGQYPSLPSPHDAILMQSSVPPLNDKAPSHPFSSSDVRIASPPHSPSPIPNPFERRVSGETITQSPLPGATIPLAFFDLLRPELDPGNASDDESVYTTHTDLRRASADSDVGLAYARDSDDDTPVVMPLDIRKSAFKGGVSKGKLPISSSSDGRPTGPSRQMSATSSRSETSFRSMATSVTGSARTRSASSATQSTARSAGALERAMETLIEEGASVSVLASGSVLASIGGPMPSRGSGKPNRSNTVPGPASPEQKAPKLPTRSHTNPSHPHIHSERVGMTGEVVRVRNRESAKRKVRVCARCDCKIEDGRWIQMDGGNVLCERCWKNMYLPKCRRCNLPIEKQAVSSRDGQLKGKYHKECFNCHTCQKLFPDKEFYVFDGKPFCAYHYHEANNSLCGASSCGQPIEGPCAVTHSGKRYHPEHLLCESESGCTESLEEYWEVDGQMLCERHAALIGGRDDGWTRGNGPPNDSQVSKATGTDEGRMMKRMTRFIDLGAGGDDELDIR